MTLLYIFVFFFHSSTDGDRESMDDYSISSISSDSAPRPIGDRPTVPLIPLTMGQYYRYRFNKPPSVERDFTK